MTYSSEGVQARWQAIQTISRGLLAELGPKFTSTKNGHIQTDIAAAGSLSGLMILQETVPNLLALSISAHGPGNVVLSEVYERQEDVLRFVTGMALGYKIKWNIPRTAKYRERIYR
jgi:hypothetical protein